MPTEQLPRRFGGYLLTASLGEDALGRVYRAVRTSGDPGFVRLRILESPELSADALIDAIEENGEIHGFLKNPAVARGVDMDAVEGVPYIAWNEPSGRTLSALSAKCRSLSRKVPVEHALLIAEKIATALDHAYNTTIDGDRTLHGLVWPGFILISDDGEIRLSGFGLAAAVLPAISKTRLAREVAPYLAPEERASATIGRNSDVFSVGAILFELLIGTPPPPDPLAVLKGTGAGAGVPILPEIQSVLKMTLGTPDSRYKSSGDLRRELGKLLFSGPYSPSTFNLAYFLNDLFRDEIEAETRARKREAALGGAGTPPHARPAPPAAPPPPPPSPAPHEPASGPHLRTETARRRGPGALVLAVLAAAAVASGIYVILRRPSGGTAPSPPLQATVRPTPTLLPELQPTPAGPTTTMSEAEFRDEVSRRLSLEVQKLEAQMRPRPTPEPQRPTTVPFARTTQEPEALPTLVELAPTSIPTVAPVEAEHIVPTAVPLPTRPAVREGALVAFEEVDSPPRIATIVKPIYPPLALKARIGGIVVLRVLVSEKGAPLDVQVIRGAPGGLDDAAASAVRRWKFTPATKAGVAVRTWMTVPIPFEP
jgi:TonB family protein